MGLHFGDYTASGRDLTTTKRGNCTIRGATRRRHADSQLLMLQNPQYHQRGSSPVEWCNRFVSFGLGYALSWSGVSSCWVGCGVSRDLVRMSRLR